MSQANQWRLKDIVDLEFFLAEDRGRDDPDLAERDRGIFLEEIKPRLAEGGLSRRHKMRLWLEARRQHWTHEPAQTPGEYYQQTLHSLIFLLAVGGGVVGASVAAAHLYYYSGRPINVMVFFTVAVLAQVLWLMFMGVGWLFRHAAGVFKGFTLIGWLVERFFLWIVEMREKALDHLHGTERLRAKAVWGELKKRHAIYGNLWLWPLLTLTQTFALGFNLGILAMILFLVTFTNRAFGWETTLQLGPDALYRVVETLALPWSWFAPYPHPAFSQVAASRIALIGPGEYPMEALISWWPFLCYAVLFYGLLPRAALLLWSRFKQAQALRSLPFDHSDCSQVLRRMEPLVVASPPGPPLAAKPVVPEESPALHPEARSCLALISRDLNLSAAELERYQQQHRYTQCERVEADIYYDATHQAWFPTLASRDWRNGQWKLVVMVDATRPPIVAVRSFIKQLRAALGKHAELTVRLVWPDQSASSYAELWERDLRSLGDPYLHVERE